MSLFVLKHLKGFVSPTRTELLLKEFRDGTQRYFHSIEKHTAFLNDDVECENKKDIAIRKKLLTSEKLILDGEELKINSHASVLYDELMPVVGEVVGKQLYPHGDLMNRFYYNKFNIGHQLGWHFDNSAFAVNILLDRATEGGDLQYGITSSTSDIGDYLNNNRSPITVPFIPGDVLIFNGSEYLHSVSPVVKGSRINLICCFGTSPNEHLNASTKRQFFEIKRPKIEKDISGVFNEKIVSTGTELGKEHDKGMPYKHVALQGLMQDEFLKLLVSESKEHLEATFKETDLFKMYQTLDLANFVECEDEEIMELRTKVPGIIKLRDALYSDRFREFVQKACNVDQKLTSRVDMALQAYSNGGHLLCHDDVIGTRAVSFIIYLTDPDTAWTPEMGGELELYPHENNIPDAVPTKKVLPTSNSMIMFKVQPGVTYHSVGETLTDEVPRLSLQGWFHSEVPAAGSEEISSLAMLKVDNDANKCCSLKPFSSLPEGSIVEAGTQHEQHSINEFFSSEEKSFLSSIVSEEYLTDDAIVKIRKQFAQDGSVQLRNFLKKTTADTILTQAISVDSEEGYPGSRDYALSEKSKKLGGILLAPPVVRRYVQYPIKANHELKISNLASELLASSAWVKFLSLATSLRPLAGRHEIRRFRPGCDYTVGYHKMLESDTRLDVSLCFTPESQGWATGDIGGFECFIESEDSQQIAAEVYGNEDDAENNLLSFHAANNNLTLVARDEQMMKFVKYVSAAAPGSRWDISSVYEIDCDGSDTEDEEDEEEPEES